MNQFSIETIAGDEPDSINVIPKNWFTALVFFTGSAPTPDEVKNAEEKGYYAFGWRKEAKMKFVPGKGIFVLPAMPADVIEMDFSISKDGKNEFSDPTE